MGLKASTVHRKLDARLKIAGLEAPDLLVVLILAAVMNLIFGRTSFGLLAVVILPSIMLLVLYFGKRDKPDGYLIHLLKFHLSPGVLSAGEESRQEDKLVRKIYEK